VFYNYRDLRLRNHLSQPLVLRVGVRPPRLWGTVLSDRPLPFRVEIIERSHRFFRGSEGKVWRENRVFRRVEYRDGRPAVESEIAHNLGRVCYPIEENRIEDVSSTEALRFPATPPGAVPDTG